MRKLFRPEEPNILRENAAEWTENYLLTKTFSWPKNSLPPIRSRLREMTQCHCAFCDGPLGTESEEVEHFRPKSRFPELAYIWQNLFPCCNWCNKKKGNKFHDMLLKPDEFNYLFDRYFWVNHHTGEINPLPTANEVDQEKARITCELYDLNSPDRKNARKSELKKWECCRHSEDLVLDDFYFRFFLE